MYRVKLRVSTSSIRILNLFIQGLRTADVKKKQFYYYDISASAILNVVFVLKEI